MNLIPAIAFGFSIAIAGIGVRFWARRLQNAARRVTAAELVEFETRPAWWTCVAPIAGIAFGVGNILAIVNERGRGLLLSGGIALFCFGAGGWWLLTLRKPRLVISQGRLTYNDTGKTVIIPADEVFRVSIYWFWFRVELKSGRILLIPNTMERSHIILAFLHQKYG